VSISQGMPGIVGSHQKLGERHRAGFPLEHLEGTGPTKSSVLDLGHQEL